MRLGIIYKILFILSISRCLDATKGPRDWKTVETLAEQHPYIVALLNITQHYNCTGTVVGEKTIISSGYCISNDPKFVAIGIATVGRKIDKRYQVNVAYTRLHADYLFDMKPMEPNVTHMHSNIGVVIVQQPILELYLPRAHIGNYFASELQGTNLKVIGFGKLESTYSWVLQYQDYIQAPCTNPKWYYCICGTENEKSPQSYENEFGNGAPVMYNSEVVAVTATSCGSLMLNTPHATYKYNVFTVLGPYLPWIKKSDPAMKLTAIINKTVRNSNPMFCINIIIFILINYLLN